MAACAGNGTKENRRTICVALLLVVVTAAAYSGIFKNDFVYYDDDVYVMMNTHVRQGLSWDNVRWAFTTFYASNWHPLTWLSHMLDVQLFGLNPAGHHFTNLLFHILAALLLFGFLRYATGKLWTGTFVAALFALHPAHVESVAWIAERKNVLSAMFWFATIWAYAYYARRPGSGRYAIVVILFALGLMAKPMLVTLPLVLLLLDWWPLKRLEMNARSFGKLAAEKLPLLVLAAASAIITVAAQQEAIASFEKLGLMTRTANAVVSYCIYIGQFFRPAGLAAFYPYPRQPLLIEAMAGTALLIAITATVFCAGKQKKYLTMGWLWYLITLMPVIGIIQVGLQAHADRYTYIPFIGIFIMISWGLETIADRLHNGGKLLVKIAAVAVVLAMAGKTAQQVGYWKSDFTLFSHAVTVTKRNYLAYNNLGFLFDRTGRMDDADTQYRKALEINPNYADAHNNLGVLLAKTGRTDEAIAQYRQALEINPNYADAHNNLGVLLAKTGRTDEAIAHYLQALEISPDFTEAHNNLGNALSQTGRTDEAIAQYQKALAIDPNYTEARNNLGNALLQTGHTDEAIVQYQKALSIDPDKISALNNLSAAFLQKGELTDAINFLQRALVVAKSAGNEPQERVIAGRLEKLEQASGSFQEKPR